ncbi:unnamed protein product [Rotaria sordida]|uniref:Apple domain-containing protein n=1 Tax=Rotaria sordida TaxID=392033 RepID=A0A814HWF5_9BILA|nr:unnamed protein product [Rotaria sordida]CAF1123891.1 unnamed protein product [Rotaria sordida]
MTKVEEHSLPYICPSAVTFHSQIDDNDLKSKSFWNPDWTIQQEISITIDKTVDNTGKIFSIKLQILIGFLIIILFIFSIILPLMILTIDPYWPSSIKKLYSCENLIIIENVYLIGIDLISNKSMTWSKCCLSCVNILVCRGFTYDIDSSICYLKTNPIYKRTFHKKYQSAIYP